MTRSEAQQKVASIKDLFMQAQLLNRDVEIAFGRHKDQTVIEDIYLDKVTGFKLPLPAKIEGGKKVSPFIFTIKCISSNLVFVLNDLHVVIVTNGIRMMIGDHKIDIRKIV